MVKTSVMPLERPKDVLNDLSVILNELEII